MSFPRYERYKNSGVEWLGEVPEHWQVKRLILMASINDEALPEDTDPDFEMEYLDIRSVTPGSDTLTPELIKFAGAPSRARRKLKDGDVLVSTVRTYLRAIAPVIDPPENLIASTGFAVVRPRHDHLPIFVNYALQASSFIEEVIARSTGVSYPAINAHELGFIKVSVPQTEHEQERIGRFLEIEVAKIDALIEEQRRLIELLKEKRQAVISHAVTKGLDPDAPMKDSGVAWLGSVPAHWSVVPVGYRYEVQLGKMLDTLKITGENLRPYLRVADVQWDQINIDDLPMMDFDESARLKFRLYPGDLLINEGGSYPGRTAIWASDIECYYQKALHRLRPLAKGADEPRYFFYLMFWALHTGVFTAGGNEATIEHLPAEKLRGYRFGFPSSGEQLRIANFLNAQTERFNLLINEAQTAIDLLHERRSALISAVVTGKIDVRNYTPKEAA